jgi:hypothetical protein
MAYLLLAALFGGLLMYLLCSGEKAVEIGRMLFFAAVLAILVALAPLTVHLLHGG